MTVKELKEILEDKPDDMVIVDWKSGYEITDVWVCDTEEYPELEGKFRYSDNLEIIHGEMLCV